MAQDGSRANRELKQKQGKKTTTQNRMWNQNYPFIQSHTRSNFIILEVTKMFPNRPNNKPDLQGCMWLWKISARKILEKEEKEIAARFHSISESRLKPSI